MEKATDVSAGDKKAGKKAPRGPKRDVERTSREEILRVSVPAGSRFKGYKSCFVRDVVLAAELCTIDANAGSPLTVGWLLHRCRKAS
ncbi:hypothetical protein B5K06_28485 [Rhizobium grahamii]|uniref:Transposase n=1 Tax=Rhizobium grahamii TaxID=1120045 RepID=A0A370KGF3_9HYPH|nr:hypothetical protein B5K06_28485 [Rhizobium grahamii]